MAAKVAQQSQNLVILSQKLPGKVPKDFEKRPPFPGIKIALNPFLVYESHPKFSLAGSFSKRFRAVGLGSF